jgi:hypothetical protein
VRSMNDDPWLALRHIRVTWDDGTTMDISINGNRAAINRYYVGKEFNVGNGELDLMKTAVSVEFIDEPIRRVVARWETKGNDWINLEASVSDDGSVRYSFIGTGAAFVLRSDRPSLKRVI